MHRLQAYTRPAPNGKDVVVDVEGITIDLITVLKATGMLKASFHDLIDQTWDAVEVSIEIPSSLKN